jgi:hypothetical protein
MQLLAFCYPVLAISTIYCIWLAYRRARLRRERVLRDRVTFMLWTVGNQIPQSGLPSAGPAPVEVLDGGAPAAAARGGWKGTSQANKGRWRKHSNHSTMLQAQEFSSPDFIDDRVGKKATRGPDIQARPKTSVAELL